MVRNIRPGASRRPWQYSLLALFVLTTVIAVLLSIGVTFPLETFIVLGLVAASAVAVLLYVGELVVLGWIIDFPAWLAERAMPAAHVPLECEHKSARSWLSSSAIISPAAASADR